ncbi:hypothetical protein ILYODFUR_032125 [Ilyodon furcidens]|uniref:Uncharacterized protein n=1 Tax=Ilyodon furcidens TaxID=33524 RepID=A0ABV0T214_9TELE
MGRQIGVRFLAQGYIDIWQEEGGIEPHLLDCKTTTLPTEPQSPPKLHPLMVWPASLQNPANASRTSMCPSQCIIIL